MWSDKAIKAARNAYSNNFEIIFDPKNDKAIRAALDAAAAVDGSPADFAKANGEERELNHDQD